jgi:hypothetical protein
MLLIKYAALHHRGKCQVFSFLDEQTKYFLYQIYHTDSLLGFYVYDPTETFMSINYHVLAITEEKDIQAPAEVNICAIRVALENGQCSDYKALILTDHNHLLQKCEREKYHNTKNKSRYIR